MHILVDSRLGQLYPNLGQHRRLASALELACLVAIGSAVVCKDNVGHSLGTHSAYHIDLGLIAQISVSADVLRKIK